MAGSAASALQVQPVEIAFAAGHVTLSATDAPVADVLAAWTRTGHAEVTGVEYLGARRISIRLTYANEADALRAIIGSPGWYSAVLRESPAPSESTFQRIVIKPDAMAAAASDTAVPETRYSYDSDPEAGKAAAALAALPATPGVKRRPAGVEPEAFY